MVLNGRRAASTIDKLTKLVSFPVYQEPQNKSYWELLDGKKDDILIYDQCGRLASHIRMPKSNMKHTHVWNGIFTVSGNQVCGKCVSPTIVTTTQRNTTPVTLATVTSTPRATRKVKPGILKKKKKN